MKIAVRFALLTLLVAALGLAACQKKAPAGATVTVNAAGAKEDTTAGVTFDWRVVGSNIEIGLKAATTGWVGVGFDPQTLMKGSNFIIGYVKDGQVFVVDHFGNQLTNHALDATLGGQDNVAGHSKGRERRHGDPFHDPALLRRPVRQAARSGQARRASGARRRRRLRDAAPPGIIAIFLITLPRRGVTRRTLSPLLSFACGFARRRTTPRS